MDDKGYGKESNEKHGTAFGDVWVLSSSHFTLALTRDERRG